MNYAMLGAFSLWLGLSALAADAPPQARILKVIHDTEPQHHDSALERIISPNEVGKFHELRDDLAPKPDGEYITAIWRNVSQETLHNVTVRLTYRQTRLVQPQTSSIQIENAKPGTAFSRFQVTGGAYTNGGPITAWKVDVVAQGRTLDSFHSFLWKDPS